MEESQIVPQSLPEPIVKRREAITLYYLAVGALAAVSVLAVVGGLVLAVMDKPAPGELWTFAALALGGLVGMVAGERQAG